MELESNALQKSIPLDLDQDGTISKSELDSEISKVQEYVRARIRISFNDQDYPLEFTSYKLEHIEVGYYLQLHYSLANFEHIPDSLTFDYSVLFDTDPAPRCLLLIGYDYYTGTGNPLNPSLIFTPEKPRQTLDLSFSSPARELRTFLREGVYHLWIGINHILFLVALILPIVLDRQATGWRPAAKFRPAVWNLVKIAAALMLAQCITLSLGALQGTVLPTVALAAAVALSVVLVALNNLFTLVRKRIWMLAFGFGLLHGFAFASDLLQLTQSTRSTLPACIGFCVGIEAGQITLIALFFPLLFLLRSQKYYRPVFLHGLSAGVGGLALVWFIQNHLILN